MPFSLKLFGRAFLVGEGGALTGSGVQRHRLALLALLATSPSRALTRDKLMALLWPERDAEHARRLLNQAVYVLRRTLGDDAILSSGDELQLDSRVVLCDVIAFEEALASGDLERAVALYSGPLLDGFFLSDAPEFERWVDRGRERLAGAYGKALEALAEAAEGLGDFRRTAEWWMAGAAHDPYDSRVAFRLMQALEAGGNPAGALQHAAMHERLLRQELGIGPAPEVAALAERLRRKPAVGVERGKQEGDPPTPTSRPDETATEAAAQGAPSRPEPAIASLPGRRLRPLVRYGVGAFVLFVLGAVFFGAIRLGFGPPGASSSAGSEPAIAVDDIARAVARELDRRARGDTAVRLPEHGTRSIAAYELYLRASDPAVLRSDSAARQGLEYFRQAIALDSTYAAAWAGLAKMYGRVTGSVALPDRGRHYALAEEAARKAIALDDSLAEAHAALGVIRMNTFDFAAAERHMARAIELDPTRARTHEWMVGLYLWTGRPTEALAEAHRAVELDPLSPSAHAELARALLFNDRCDEALAYLERIAAVRPPLLRAAPIATECYARKQMWQEAIAEARRAPEQPFGEVLLGYLLARAGRRDEALRIRETLLDRWRRGSGEAFSVAVVEAGLGDLDQTFAWLDRAIDDRSLHGGPAHLSLLLMGPLFERVHRDPRFERLRERLGLQNQ